MLKYLAVRTVCKSFRQQDASGKRRIHVSCRSGNGLMGLGGSACLIGELFERVPCLHT